MRSLFIIIFKHKLLFILLILACILRSILVIILNKGYSLLIDQALSGNYEKMAGSSFLLLTSGILQVAIIFSQNNIASLLSEKSSYYIRQKAVKSFLNTDYKNVETLSTGDTLSKLNLDIERITSWIKNNFTSFIFDSILLTSILSTMLFMNFKLTIISFSFIPVLSVISYRLSKPITRAEEIKNETGAQMNSTIKNILDAFSILHLYEMQRFILNKCNEKIKTFCLSEITANKVRALLMSLGGFFSYTPTLILWSYGSYLTINGRLSAGTLLAFINMSGFVFTPLINLPSHIDMFKTSCVNVSRVFTMFSTITYKERKCSIMQPSINEEIVLEFKDVYFGYSKDSYTLKKLNFQIQKGTTVAIVGESGCGKSTILKLISGLYPIDSGEILFEGKSINETDLVFIRRNISYIPQEALLFPVSIHENITCGHPIPAEVVHTACKAACLDTLISKLPEGINTNIGEYGHNLSGGERQRINIARAIAKNAPIFLFDEATSSLDAQTGDKVLSYIHSISGIKTIIYVTHQIKTTVNADIILCMKNGEIGEIGTHTALMNLNGYYARLYHLQEAGC